MKYRVVNLAEVKKAKVNEDGFFENSGTGSSEVVKLISFKVVNAFLDLCKEILMVAPLDCYNQDIAVDDAYKAREVAAKISSILERRLRASDERKR